MDTTPRALWYIAPQRAEIRPAAAPPPGPAEITVASHTGALSRGTESLVFHGRVPPSEYDRMRAPHQQGAFPFPVQYGYAIAGHVDAGPDEWIGRRVFCLHPHQTRFTLPVADAHEIPAAIPFRRAILAPQIETALNASWDAAPRPGDTIAIIGAGTIGCLVAWLCAAIPGCTATLIDTNPARARTAHALGARFATPAEAPANADLVFHASSTPSGLATAIACAGFEATIIELSWYGEGTTPVPLGGAFHSQRLTLRASQVGHVAPERRARWPHRRRLALALSLAADPRLDVLVTESTPFDALPAALPGLLRAPGALSHRILYPDNSDEAPCSPPPSP